MLKPGEMVGGTQDVGWWGKDAKDLVFPSDAQQWREEKMCEHAGRLACPSTTPPASGCRAGMPDFPDRGLIGGGMEGLGWMEDDGGLGE